ncbi:MAG: hypothetical protein IKE66_05080 [Hyphomicrobium sp.]|nr:hypothetical protein [Hyphomicrobium sp.]
MTRYRVHQKPVFERLVEELLQGDGAEESHFPRPASTTLHGAALWSIGPENAAPTEATDRVLPYMADAFAPDPEVLPSELPVDAESIFSELGLRPGLTAYQIRAIRRNFARFNHPDRFPMALQANATERMMIANALCDAYPLTAI